MKKIALNDLFNWEENPRDITDEAMERLKSSLSRNPEFLERRPLLATPLNGKLTVYAGNQRLKAAKALGWEKIPVQIVEEITREKMLEEAMVDNVQWGILVKEKLYDLGLDSVFLADLNIKLDTEEIEDNGISIEKKYEVSIECDNEDMQRKVYDELTTQGYNCKILTI